MTDAASIPTGIHVRFVDDIAIMWLNNGENRFNLNSVQQMNAALDEVERNESVKALIITGVGKYFSCGLDLAWLSVQENATLEKFFPAYQKYLSRLLVFPVPTVAAVNGHAYAAGGFMVMSCDYRIMRTQRGWICFPEINIKIAIRSPTVEMLRMKLRDSIVFRDMALYGRRVTGEEAKEMGVVDECVEMKDLMATSLAFTRKRIGRDGYDRTIVQEMKQNLYGDICDRTIAYRHRDVMSGKQKAFSKAHKARL